MTRKTTRPRGYAEWNPQAATRVLLANVEAIVDDYRAYLPLTVRQLFYRLVGAFGYPKTEESYAQLCEKLNRARRAGLLSWDAIRDDRPTETRIYADTDLPSFLRDASYGLAGSAYRLHPRTDQPLDVLVACEASGMVPMLESAVADLGATVASSGGFDSVTQKREIALRAKRHPLVVLHVGDHDPSGVHLFSSFAEDVTAFAEAEGAFIRSKRVAVLPEHITEYDLETAPPKRTDRRSFEGETVQAEALAPDVLVGIVRQAVEDFTDLGIFEATRNRQAEERERLESILRPIRADLCHLAEGMSA